MLTSGQCRHAAYTTDGGIVCLDCGNAMIEEWLKEQGITHEAVLAKLVDEYNSTHEYSADKWKMSDLYDQAQDSMQDQAMEALDMTPLIQYSLDEFDDPEGLYCECGTELVEPTEPEEEEHDEDEDDETGESL